MAKAVTQRSYRSLIRFLKKEIHAGIQKAEMAFQVQRVLTYWRMGAGMHRFLLDKNETDTFHLRQIEPELGISLDVLRKILKLYRVFPDLPAVPPLSWTQYRALLTAPDGIRKSLQTRAVKEGIGSEKLYAIISDFRKKAKQERSGLGKAKGACLKCVRGRLFVYKTLQSKTFGLKKNEIMVDCGFKIRHKVTVPSSSRITGGNLVLSVKTEEGYKLRQSLKDDRKLYTYAAKLVFVIDADTLILNVDVGFDTWLDMTVRLRGIDAPELSTRAGYMARRFVVSRLKKAETLVIKAYKAGKFGRYLVDVYYSRKRKADPTQIAKEGIFLNQQLLDEGLARLYDE